MRRRITMSLNFFYLEQTPIPSDINNSIAEKIVDLSARLTSTTKTYEQLSQALHVQCGPITMKERIEMTAELDALVAYHYGISRDEYSYIISSFSGFEEDKNLEKLRD
jgi:hypothetical protein